MQQLAPTNIYKASKPDTSYKVDLSSRRSFTPISVPSKDTIKLTCSYVHG